MSDNKTHALLSPSGADRWMSCVGSVALVKDLPEESNSYSDEGTDYHILAAVCLDEGTNAEEYVGHHLESGALVTEENAAYVQEYVDAVRSYAEGGTLLVEERVPIGHLTGEEGAEGTSDAVILRTDHELVVCDLKFGRGVTVLPEGNRQLMIYALGVLEKHQLVDDFETVQLVISQPRAGGTHEWVCSVIELQAFAEEVKRFASQIMTTLKLAATTPGGRVDLPLTPSEKACRFCKAKAICPALLEAVDAAASVGFDDLENIPVEGMPNRATVIGEAMQKVSLVETWCKAVRAAAETELLAGRAVDGYKLVQGKRGNRKFTDLEAAEKALRRTRLKIEELFDMTLISPTVAEKRIANKFPRIWEEVKGLIAQSEGVPSVAPESDKRPALVVTKPEDGFDNLVEAASADDLL